MVGLARTEQIIHREHQPLQAGGWGLMGTEAPSATSVATAGHQPGARAALPQHIQRCLSAWIREQALEWNKNIQVTSNNTMTLALGNYYQLYRGVCAADNSTKEVLSW